MPLRGPRPSGVRSAAEPPAQAEGRDGTAERKFDPNGDSKVSEVLECTGRGFTTTFFRGELLRFIRVGAGHIAEASTTIFFVEVRARGTSTHMRLKLLTFRYSATLGGFDDTPLADFTRDKEVIAQREHFYLVNDTPHITLVITYQDAIVPREALEAARAIPPRAPSAAPAARFDRSRRDGAPDPCAGLDENERALFNTLREWRSKQAHDEGLPPYLLLTNKQFVTIVRKRPESLNALGHIDGIGPGKLERYGAAILACAPLASGAEAGIAAP